MKLEFAIMPTPFTHLEIAQRLIDDEALPQSIRDYIRSELGAFLLGNISADARVDSGSPRETTHFYSYNEKITRAPWRRMVEENKSLLSPHSPEHRVFVAGYIAHLSVDEYWTRNMVGPHFFAREWADRVERFYMLHIILSYMDERDLNKLDTWQPDVLCEAQPTHWLPFISDENLSNWRDLVQRQIIPSGVSQTLEIFGHRLGKPAQELRDFLDSEEKMQIGLWNNIAQSLLSQIEADLYQYAREQMLIYLQETE